MVYNPLIFVPYGIIAADYNLTYEEVKIVDPDIEQIISEEEYEKYANLT